MKTKILLVLAAIASVSLLSGCASQTVRGGKAVSVLDGLYYSRDAAFTPPTINTLDNYDARYAVNAKPSGKQVSLLWGAITYTDY